MKALLFLIGLLPLSMPATYGQSLALNTAVSEYNGALPVRVSATYGQSLTMNTTNNEYGGFLPEPPYTPSRLTWREHCKATRIGIVSSIVGTALLFPLRL